jgi:autotransporter adhesin
MNRNYKVIWNRSLGCFTAVAEYAKSQGKSSTGTVSSSSSASAAVSSGARLLRMSAICAGLAAAGLSMQASADFLGDSGQVIDDGSDNIRIQGGVADQSKLTNNNIGVIGNNTTKTLTIKLAEDINLGNNGSVTIGQTLLDNDSLTITNSDGGTRVQQSGISFFDGFGDPIGPSLSVTGFDANNTQIINLESAGSLTDPLNAKNAVNVTDLNDAIDANKIKYFSVSSTRTGNEDNDGATGDEAIAIGGDSVATADNAVAIGRGTEASGENSVAIGDFSYATKASTVAIGDDADATADNAVAIGRNSDASGENSVAIGDGAESYQAGAIAIGDSSDARQIDSIAIGADSDADGANAIAMGKSAIAEGFGSVAIGFESEATKAGSNAVGYKNKSLAAGSSALGNQNKAEGTTSSAVGYKNTASGIASSVFGSNSQATANGATAIGNNSLADEANTISVGRLGSEKRITNVAVGTNDTDAVNVTQLNEALQTPLNFVGDRGNVERKLGQTLSVRGNADLGDTLIDGNIGVEADNSDGSLIVKLVKDIDLSAAGSLTIGKSVLADNGLTLSDINGDGKSVRLRVVNVAEDDKTRLSVGSAKIVGVEDGEIGETSRQAINGRQLFATEGRVSANRVVSQGNMDALGGGVDSTTGAYIRPTYDIKTNDAAGAVTTTGYNTVGEALTALNGAVQTPLSFAGDDGTTTRKLGQTLSVKGGADTNELSTGNNIGVVADDSDGSLAVKLAKELTGLTSATFGDVVISDSGLDNGQNKITNVSNGDIAEDGLDAVNGGQLFTVQTAAAAAQDTADKGFAISAANGDTIQKNLGEAVKIVGSNSNLNTTVNTDGNLEVALNNQLDLSAAGSLTVGNSRLNSSGLTLTSSNPDAETAVISVGNVPGEKRVSFNGAKIVGIANATLDATSKQAVNGSQLFNTTESIGAIIGGNVVNTDGVLTVDNGTDGIGLTGTNTIDDAIKAVNLATGVNATSIAKGIKLGNGDLDTTDDQELALGDTINVIGGSNLISSVNGSGITVALKNQIDLSSAGSLKIGNASLTNSDGRGFSVNGAKIVGVADGNISANSQQAINGSQLNTTNNLIANIISGTTGIVREDNGNGALSIGSNAGATGKNAIAMGVGAIASGKNSISIGTGNKVIGASSGAIGDPTTITGNGSYSLGNDNTISNNFSFTVGNNNTISGTRSFALGNRNTISSNNAFALGNDITIGTGLNGAVGIGNNTTVAASTIASFTPTGPTSVIGTATGSNVVSIGSDGKERRLTNVAAGGADTDAVNVSQLRAVDGKVDQGFNISADNGLVSDNVKLNETIKFTNSDGNLVSTVSDNGINYDLADDIKVNQVTIGDGTNDTILTTNARGLSVNGSKIVDIADGNVNGSSRQAVNGRQLFKVADSVATNLGGGSVFDAATGTITAPSYLLDDGTNTSTNATFNDVGTALGNIDGRVVTNTAKIAEGINLGDGTNDNNFALGDTINITGDSNLTTTASATGIQVKLRNNIDLTNSGSVKVGRTFINNDGITIGTGPKPVILTNQGLFITDGASITKAGGVNAGDQKITNVKAGSANTDAVNVGQLNDVSDLVNKGWDITAAGGNSSNVGPGDSVDFNSKDGNITVSKDTTSNDISFELNKDLNLDSVSFGGGANNVNISADGLDNGGKKIINVRDGEVSANSQDAINGSQLFDTDNIAKGNMAALGGGAAYDSITNIYTAPKYTLNNGNNDPGTTDYNNVGAALGNLDNRTTTNTNKITANTIDIGKNTSAIDDLTSGKTGLVQQDPTGTGTITVGKDTGGTSVDFTNKDGKDRVLTGVAAGVADNDAVNVGQLNAQGEGVAGIIGGTTYDPATGTFTNTNIGGTGEITIDAAIGAVKKAAAARTTLTAGNNIVLEPVANGDGSTNYRVSTAPNLDVVSVKAGDSTLDTTGLKVTDAAGNTGTYGAASSSLTNAAGNSNNSTATSNTITNGTNVTTVTGSGTKVTDGTNTTNYGANGFSINNDTNTTVINQAGVSFTDNLGAATGPSIKVGGIDAGNKVITGVADGMAPRDAVNFGQLEAVNKRLGDSVNALGYRIGEVEDDANAGISAAMAMSSLPQAYIAGKSMVGGGIASYNGESAVAIGVSKVSDNGRWVIKVNGTADTQGNAGGAIGAGFHF